MTTPDVVDQGEDTVMRHVKRGRKSIKLLETR
jgi:hypothetical protein